MAPHVGLKQRNRRYIEKYCYWANLFRSAYLKTVLVHESLSAVLASIGFHASVSYFVLVQFVVPGKLARTFIAGKRCFACVNSGMGGQGWFIWKSHTAMAAKKGLLPGMCPHVRFQIICGPETLAAGRTSNWLNYPLLFAIRTFGSITFPLRWFQAPRHLFPSIEVQNSRSDGKIFTIKIFQVAICKM